MHYHKCCTVTTVLAELLEDAETTLLAELLRHSSNWCVGARIFRHLLSVIVDIKTCATNFGSVTDITLHVDFLGGFTAGDTYIVVCSCLDGIKSRIGALVGCQTYGEISIDDGTPFPAFSSHKLFGC